MYLSCHESQGGFLSGSGTCPDLIKISAPTKIAELKQNLTLIFTPSLNDPLTTNPITSAEDITQKHLKFNFKRKEKSEEPLTILEKNLTHTKDSSLLFVRFLEKMRVSNTEDLVLKVENPWLYRSAGQSSPIIVKYFLNKEYRIPVVEESGPTEEDETKDELFTGLRYTKAALGLVASASVLLSGFTGGLGPLSYLIRLLNIIEIISNLSKINIHFGARINAVLEFIEQFKIPEIEFLARLSPIKDHSFEDPDVDAYVRIPRGSRGKITTSNGEVFIASGKNFMIGCLIIGFWAFSQLFGYFLSKMTSILIRLVFVYQALLGTVFFDFQLICMAG